jgi:hypothetical protein
MSKLAADRAGCRKQAKKGTRGRFDKQRDIVNTTAFGSVSDIALRSSCG